MKLVNLIFCGLLLSTFCFGFGYCFGRKPLQNYTTERNVSVGESDPKSAASTAQARISEEDKIALARWLGRHELFRIAFRLKAVSDGKMNLGRFNDLVDFELVDCISDSFELERVLLRLDITPTAHSVAQKCFNLLECKNELDLREKADSLGFSNSLYPHFNESECKAYKDFTTFITNVLSKNKEQ